jgi:argininosuccinate lyase
MQEDKEPTFDATDSLSLAITAMAGMITDLEANSVAMRAALEVGFPTATDLADWLVRELGLPFREAHHATGRIVSLAEAQGCLLEDLSLEMMQSVESGINSSIYSVLSVDASAESRTSFGGTAPENVRAAAAKARERFL